MGRRDFHSPLRQKKIDETGKIPGYVIERFAGLKKSAIPEDKKSIIQQELLKHLNCLRDAYPNQEDVPKKLLMRIKAAEGQSAKRKPTAKKVVVPKLPMNNNDESENDESSEKAEAETERLFFSLIFAPKTPKNTFFTTTPEKDNTENCQLRSPPRHRWASGHRGARHQERFRRRQDFRLRCGGLDAECPPKPCSRALLPPVLHWPEFGVPANGRRGIVF